MTYDQSENRCNCESLTLNHFEKDNFDFQHRKIVTISYHIRKISMLLYPLYVMIIIMIYVNIDKVNSIHGTYSLRTCQIWNSFTSIFHVNSSREIGPHICKQSAVLWSFCRQTSTLGFEPHKLGRVFWFTAHMCNDNLITEAGANSH